MREHTYVIDVDGIVWFGDEFYEDPVVYRAFFDNITRAPDGRFYADCLGERCWIEPVDAPFVVQSVDVAADGSAATLTLTGGIEIPLDPSRLSIGRDNVLYARAKKDQPFRARFSRKAYYEIAQRIVPDGSTFSLELGGKRWPIAGAPSPQAP